MQKAGIDRLRFAPTIPLMVMIVIISGCMNLGPDYNKPDIGVASPEQFISGGVVSEPGAPFDDRWWEVFRNPEINKLVEDVVRNNWDIKKAAARVLEIRANFTQTRADRFPSATWKGSGSRTNKNVDVEIPGPLSIGPGGQVTVGPSSSVSVNADIEQFNLSLPVTFELDLWGRLARAEEAARADLLQAEESRRTIIQSLIAEAVSLYLTIESIERRIQVADLTVQNYRRNLDIIEWRYERGLVDVLSLRQSRRVLAQAETNLPALRQDLGTAQQRLAVLAGRYPETMAPKTHPEDYYKKLDPIPPGLPAELLLRRPDVNAAEAALRALNARVGVAKASRFPVISLTGNFGFASDDLGKLFEPDSQLFSFAMNLAGPIFNAGKLKAVQKASEARYQQGVAEYAKTVLTAFREVEAALLTRKEQLERRELTLNWLQEARAAQRAAESRYERGLTSYLNVLESTRARYVAEESLILIDMAIMTNRVTLHRALGGGWDKAVNNKSKLNDKDENGKS